MNIQIISASKQLRGGLPVAVQVVITYPGKASRVTRHLKLGLDRYNGFDLSGTKLIQYDLRNKVRLQ
jgi:hypothetical protein